MKVQLREKVRRYRGSFRFLLTNLGIFSSVEASNTGQYLKYYHRLGSGDRPSNE